MTLVSDNGTPFQSTEFSNFMKANGIVHHRVPPYHPSSNGLAENMVKSVKQSLSKSKFTKDATIETHFARFLASYRNTRHNTTVRTPAELLFNRVPQTRLSLVHPCTRQCLEQTVEKRVGDHQPRSFTINSDVLVRDLRPNSSTKWCKGTISKVLGPLNYQVRIDGYECQAHIDHILPCTSTIDDSRDDTASIPPTDAQSHQDDDDVLMPIVNYEPDDA